MPQEEDIGLGYSRGGVIKAPITFKKVSVWMIILLNIRYMNVILLTIYVLIEVKIAETAQLFASNY